MRGRTPIDPALRQYLDAIAAATPSVLPEANSERVTVAREGLERALSSRESIPGLPNAVQVRELAIAPGVSARLYTPAAGVAKPLPVLVYLHGGGWVAGSVATHDPFCRLLSEAAGLLVLSVEYRLAPEHPFPAALDDTLVAVRWAAGHAEEWGGDPRQLAVGGDSAGANLAAVAANELAGEGSGPSLRALLLLYPVADHPSAKHASYAENAICYGLEAERMRWFWEQYAQGGAGDDPRLSPLRLERLPALPPVFVATAEYDVLRDEGLAYAARLEQAGVAVTHVHAPEMHHNFPVSPGTVARFPQSLVALGQMAGWLRATFAEKTG